MDSDGIVDTSNLSTAFDRFLAQSGRPNLAQARGPYLTAFGILPALWPTGPKQGLCTAGWCKRWFAQFVVCQKVVCVKSGLCKS